MRSPTAWHAFERDTLEDHAFAGIVVGLPRRLGGEDTDQTASARALADALTRRKGFVVHMQDERLTSREAESRLAEARTRLARAQEAD